MKLINKFNQIDNYHPLWKEGCSEITNEIAINFYIWMMENNTAENAEKWANYSDQDMFRAFIEETL